MNRYQLTKAERHRRRMEKYLYVLNYILEHGAVKYDELLENRPFKGALRPVISYLYRHNLIEIGREKRNATAAYRMRQPQYYYILHRQEVVNTIRRIEFLLSQADTE
jgi:transcription initiation factor IIE alpha subunit